MSRLRTTALVSLVALLGFSTACAGFESQTSLRALPIDPRLNVGNMGVRNNFELRNTYALRSDDPQDTAPADNNTRARRPVTPILFWLGVGLTIVGGAGTIGTAAAGYGTKRQLANEFNGSITASEAQTLERRGNTLNKASIAGVVVTVIGAVLAITSYGVDYTRCGPLAPKRRRNTAPSGRCADDDSK